MQDLQKSVDEVTYLSSTISYCMADVEDKNLDFVVSCPVTVAANQNDDDENESLGEEIELCTPSHLIQTSLYTLQ
jgi:hypothetical protein